MQEALAQAVAGENRILKRGGDVRLRSGLLFAGVALEMTAQRGLPLRC